VSSDQYDAPPPRGQWALAWRRLKRDRVALGCGVFLVVLVFAVGPGAPLYERIVGHGPNDPFPYAVSVQLRPSGPLTVTWDAVILAVTLVAGAAIILLNLVADLVVLALDPTLARSSRRGLLRLAGRTA